jgi:ATP-dependent protease ClpP protease subunit
MPARDPLIAQLPDLSAFPRRQVRLFNRLPGLGFDARSLGGATEILIYDEIGPFGVTAKAVKAALAEAPGDLVVRINSPGGDVFDGIAIASDLRAHPGHVRVEVTGLAASAASIIAMAGDEIAMAENSFLMIHNASGLVIGTRHDMRALADVLQKIDGELARAYASRTGISVRDIARMMDAETWIAATEAKDRGFADEIIAPAKVSAAWDLSIYTNVPTALAHKHAGRESQPTEPAIRTRRELEKLLRTAGGMSRAAAERVSDQGWSAMPDTDDQADALEALGRLVEDSTTTLSNLRRTRR